MSKEKILVSACLMGANVRYDGANNGEFYEGYLQQWQHEGRLVSICPEMIAGLPVPRPGAEIVGKGGGDGVITQHAKVITKQGHDVSSEFLRGADSALALVEKHNIKIAILKARSPSCGNENIYDGTFSQKTIEGSGVTAALLINAGIKVFNEKQLDEAAEYLLSLV